jgi:hypothetical protein
MRSHLHRRRAPPGAERAATRDGAIDRPASIFQKLVLKTTAQMALENSNAGGVVVGAERVRLEPRRVERSCA